MQIRLLTLVLLSVFALSDSLGQAKSNVTSPTPRFSYADLQRLQAVEDVELSPDGKNVAYAVSSIDTARDLASEKLFVLNLSQQGASSVVLPGAATPAWSPDGRKLAVVHAAGDGKSSVQLLRSNDLQPMQTFPVPSAPGSLLWSPDGKWIAFTLFVPDAQSTSFLQNAVETAEGQLVKPSSATWAPSVQITQAARYRRDGGAWLKPGHSQIFVLSMITGKVRPIETGTFNVGDPAWMPDSRTLLFTSDHRPEAAHANRKPAIFITDLSGHVTQLTHDQASHYAPAASPDGKWIAYTQMPYRSVNYTRNDLYIMRVDGSEVHRLAADLDRDLYGPQWNPDGQSIFAEYADHGIFRLGSFALNGKSKEVASGIGNAFSIASDGTIAYAGKSATEPDELRLQRPGAKSQALTSLNDFLHQRTLGKLLQLDARSSADGTPVEGWALMPAGVVNQTRLPTIVALHGGPFGSDGPDWSSRYQLLAAAGYAVVTVNYRGSTSYGASFSEPANHDFPGAAFDDVMSIVDEAVHRGIADPNRLFLTGGSAGGQLTVWSTGKTNRFKAAVAEKPVIELMSDALTTDQYLASPDIYEGYPWTREQALWAHSPLSLAGSITTPTLLIVGEEDYRTPIDQALQLFDALQLQGVPTALMRVPGAGHESLESRPSQLAAETAATLAWFAQYDHPPTSPQLRPVTP